MSNALDKMRPAGAYEEVLQLRQRDGEWFYREYASRFVEVDCPSCGAKGRKEFVKFGFEHRRCASCRTLYVSPRPGHADLVTYYNTYESPRAWTKLLVQSDASRKALQYEPRAARLVRLLREQGSAEGGLAVDVGAGSGAFALALQATNFFGRVLALDFSSDCVEACRSKGLEAQCGSLEDLPQDHATFLATNDLLEHLSDPARFIRDCHRALRANGVLSIATPNGEGFDFQILRERTRNIVPPEHLTYFNPASVKVFLERGGFEVLSVETPGTLDVEIIRKEIANGLLLEDHDRFLAHLFRQEASVLTAFQGFLAAQGLSSHMLVTARKA